MLVNVECGAICQLTLVYTCTYTFVSHIHSVWISTGGCLPCHMLEKLPLGIKRKLLLVWKKYNLIIKFNY